MKIISMVFLKKFSLAQLGHLWPQNEISEFQIFPFNAQCPKIVSHTVQETFRMFIYC